VKGRIKFSRVPNENNRILAVLTDLMFLVKIQGAAKEVGLLVTCVKSRPDALKHARNNPSVVILDLNLASAEPLELIADMKSDSELSKVPLLAFVSHVHADLIQAAREKGCDTVVARSAFSQNLPAILRGFI
jgi:CheY-like chemotaxis protein